MKTNQPAEAILSGVIHQPLIYQTSNLNIACFLICSGLTLKDTIKIGPGRAAFLFDDPEGIGDDLEVQFESGATVKAKDFCSARSFLKRRVYRVVRDGQ